MGDSKQPGAHGEEDQRLGFAARGHQIQPALQINIAIKRCFVFPATRGPLSQFPCQ